MRIWEINQMNMHRMQHGKESQCLGIAIYKMPNLDIAEMRFDNGGALEKIVFR